MNIIKDIISRIARLERNIDQFVAEFDTGIAIAKRGADVVRLVDRSLSVFGREGLGGVAYFRQGSAPKCDYIEVYNHTEHRYMKHQKDIEVNADGTPVTTPTPTKTVAAEAALPKVKKARRRSTITNASHIKAFTSLPVDGTYEIAKRDWKSTTDALTSAIHYHGKKNGQKLSLRTRGNHFFVTRRV